MKISNLWSHISETGNTADVVENNKMRVNRWFNDEVKRRELLRTGFFSVTDFIWSSAPPDYRHQSIQNSTETRCSSASAPTPIAAIFPFHGHDEGVCTARRCLWSFLNCSSWSRWWNPRSSAGYWSGLSFFGWRNGLFHRGREARGKINIWRNLLILSEFYFAAMWRSKPTSTWGSPLLKSVFVKCLSRFTGHTAPT